MPRVLFTPKESFQRVRRKFTKEDFQHRAEGLIRRIIRFANLLRKNRVPVHTSNERDAIAALEHIDINSRFEFYMALRSNMIVSHKYYGIFDILFLNFWRTGVHMPKRYGGDSEDPDDEEPSVHKLGSQEDDEEGHSKKDSKRQSNVVAETAVPTYSLAESFREKDFESIKPNEMALFDEIFKHLKVNIKEKKGRRFRPSNQGKCIDLRRSIRQSTQRGGDIVKILKREKKPKQSKIVIIADVSGSMDTYSSFLVKFVYGLQKYLRDTETFVFSTKLRRITDLLGYRSLRSALAMIAQQVTFWSGGTDIGGSLAEFNSLYGGRLRKHNRILVVLSDGWDKGDVELLKKQMVMLKRGFKKIIWLNPNLKYDEYQPLCLGMAAAMPYVDHFLPCHNLKTLEQFIEVVKKI